MPVARNREENGMTFLRPLKPASQAGAEPDRERFGAIARPLKPASQAGQSPFARINSIRRSRASSCGMLRSTTSRPL